jgi:hypothetical protein
MKIKDKEDMRILIRHALLDMALKEKGTYVNSLEKVDAGSIERAKRAITQLALLLEDESSWRLP